MHHDDVVVRPGGVDQRAGGGVDDEIAEDIDLARPQGGVRGAGTKAQGAGAADDRATGVVVGIVDENADVGVIKTAGKRADDQVGVTGQDLGSGGGWRQPESPATGSDTISPGQTADVTDFSDSGGTTCAQGIGGIGGVEIRLVTQHERAIAQRRHVKGVGVRGDL